MKKYESYLIQEPVFETSVALIVNCSFEEMKKWDEARRHPDEDPLSDREKNANGFCYAARNKLGEHCFVVYVKKFDWTVQCMGVLIHELTHLIFRICDYKNIPIRLENDEVFCYLLEYYQRQALSKLKGHAPQLKKRNRKKS